MLLLYGVILDQRRDFVREVLDILSRRDHRPALYCSAGKDRTGIISALLLGLAGASAETIAGDYALSARYLVRRYREEILGGEESSPCTWEDAQREWCPPERMLEMMSYLEREHGGIERYVRATGLRSDQVASLRGALVG